MLTLTDKFNKHVFCEWRVQVFKKQNKKTKHKLYGCNKYSKPYRAQINNEPNI